MGEAVVVVVLVGEFSQSCLFESRQKCENWQTCWLASSKSSLGGDGGGGGGGGCYCYCCWFLLCQWRTGMDEASALVHVLWWSLVCRVRWACNMCGWITCFIHQKPLNIHAIYLCHKGAQKLLLYENQRVARWIIKYKLRRTLTIRKPPSWRGSVAQRPSFMMPRDLLGRRSWWRSWGPWTLSWTQSSLACALPWNTYLLGRTEPEHSSPPTPKLPLPSSTKPAGVGHAWWSLQCTGFWGLFRCEAMTFAFFGP